MATAAIPDAVRDPLVEPAGAGLTRAGTVRVDAIDRLRGLVIALMVLDHVRDFFHVDVIAYDPTDPARTTAILFATRWITHLCAPTFVFLAGVSIHFQKADGKPDAALSRFLLTRGAWLVVLECTLVSFGFNFGAPFLFLQVIWAIGMSMIAMSLIACLPTRAVLAIGGALLLVCPLLLAATEGATGLGAIVRTIAIAPGTLPGLPTFQPYPVLPWLAVMCLGFGLGPVFRQPARERRRAVLGIALGLLAAFLVLRGLNGYGDPAPWHGWPTAGQTVMGFLNISKYPPSPDYVAITLGLSLLLFLLLERLGGAASRVLLDFGRTPLFTYLCHLYIAHGLMLLTAAAMGMPAVAINLLPNWFAGTIPASWGFSLTTVYCVWLLVLAMLVPLARWFAGVKRRRRDWWLGYL
ncbi:heparan-alpha-glucosaminide N-acetyltransferase domain-containing protein [Sphingomonas sp. 1P06PA]|uniref:DUF1624 domain-containing protein n=1 Tax=Sphingomonas sp. 1P06PA TaxID=554121 RepID=UPI0039A6CD34